MFLKEYVGQTKVFTQNEEQRQVTYLTRIDPLSGNVAKISEERSRRSVGISVNLQIQPTEDCEFCAFQERTPKERIEHACGAISVPNKYPWEKYDWITIYPPFSNHKLLLSDLYFDDLERMIESSYELAMICSQDPDVISFIDFTNWGVFAGASQQHPHSQRKSTTQVPSPSLDNEMKRCHNLMERYNCNPFSLLEQEERMDGRRVIHDDDIFIVAMFAPSCPEEIIVFPKDDIAHILQTTLDDRRSFTQSVLGIIQALFFCRGVTNLNIAMHMATYAQIEQARRYYRWHMHIYPRRNRLPADRAGAEIGFGTQIIDTMPEVTAELLRRWYKDGPRGELVAKTRDGLPNQNLLDEFNRFVKTALNRSPT